MASKRALNELIIKEIDSSSKPQHVKDLAKTLLELEMDNWDPSIISKRYSEMYVREITLAARKARQ
ncbi:Uncharacterised protein [uncultured archaeon]|nr:Uncharacterised protein [uncultured archaeon]